MKGANKGKGKGTQDKPGKDLNRAEQTEDDTREEGQYGDDPAPEMVRTGFEAISKQISELKSELKQDLKMLKEEIKHDMREEFVEFKQDVNQQLATNTQAMKEQSAKINEMTTRVDDMETWSAEADAALKHMLQDQQKLEDKLNDLESRARRNNLRIHGVPEDAEGGSVTEFVDKLLRTELKLSDDVDLQIQRAHRALAPKPSPNMPPRSIILNFQQYSMKEMIIQKAWRQKITVGEKRLYFDHDYTATVLQQRKAYINIKKALKLS